jgi:hypothetical protein
MYNYDFRAFPALDRGNGRKCRITGELAEIQAMAGKLSQSYFPRHKYDDICQQG